LVPPNEAITEVPVDARPIEVLLLPQV